MKTLLALTLGLLCSASVFAIETLDIALEADSLKLEYYETTQRGIIRLKGCTYCDQDIYEFKSKPAIEKNGKEITFDFFLKDFWNARSPTIFLDKKTKHVIRVIYLGGK